jgi:thioredoxin reductase (NADPH)
LADPDPRHDQTFPVLSAAQLASARRFASAPPRRFAPGEPVYEVGARHVPAWLVLEGEVEVTRRSGGGAQAVVTRYRPGEVTGETSQLSGLATLTGGVAGPRGALAAPFDAAHLRALLIGSAEIGELLMRAFILRRVALIEAGRSGTAGPVLLGERRSADVVRLSGFLTRNGYPHSVLAVDEPQGHELVERLGVPPPDLPILLCPNGALLKRPTEAEAASCLGITPELDAARLYDVAIVGAGPAGLATAVYGASEGLSVIVLDSRAFGGQAGASARIENYLGFPTGISGQALAGRAFNQAAKFGAELGIPLEVEALECGPADAGAELALALRSGQVLRARTVVVASGARYRRPALDRLEAFEGAGVSYWASPIEARLVEGQDVVLVGGGNSAGQAVVFLSPFVKTLHLVARRPLAETMSRYLVDRIKALANVVLHTPCEIEGLEGEVASGLQGARLRDRRSGETVALAVRHLFLFIGAEPNTAWLSDCLRLDDRGFILTGEVADAGSSLQSSRSGVFAVGDVRAGSVKRVAAAVGEGAAVVAQIHALLAKADG